MGPVPVRPGSVSTGIGPMCRGPASLEGPPSLLSQWPKRCRRDNSTVPGLPIQRSYGTHSHTTFPTLNSILFWPVKAVGNRITIGICNMSHTPQ